MSTEKDLGSSNDRNMDSDNLSTNVGWGWRHVQVFMLWLAITMAYILKINLSVCIVEMTNVNSTSGYPIFDWSESEQDLTLSALFWGYIVTQVPGGLLAQRYGPKWFMLLGIFCNVVLCAFIPLAAEKGGWQALCAVRALQGLAQGFVYPCAHRMLSRWAPPSERGCSSSIVYSGKALGTIFAMAVSGLLSGSSLGWPSGFYVPAGIGIVWCIAWAALASDTPATSRFTSARERDWIERELGDTAAEEQKYDTPWLSIFTSLPMWAIILNHCGQNFGGWVLLSKMPTYMKNVLGFDISTDGVDSALPYVCLLVLSFIVSWTAPLFTRRFSVVASRKFYNTLAMVGAAVSLLLLAYTNPTEGVAIFLLSLAGGFEAGTFAGYLVNHIDLSPNFGGAMMGVTNGIATLVAILVPILVGLVTGDASEQTKAETKRRWNIVFLLCAGVYFACSLFFVLFGKASVQSWNTPKKLKSQERLECEDGGTKLDEMIE